MLTLAKWSITMCGRGGGARRGDSSARRGAPVDADRPARRRRRQEAAIGKGESTGDAAGGARPDPLPGRGGHRSRLGSLDGTIGYGRRPGHLRGRRLRPIIFAAVAAPLLSPVAPRERNAESASTSMSCWGGPRARELQDESVGGSGGCQTKGRLKREQRPTRLSRGSSPPDRSLGFVGTPHIAAEQRDRDHRRARSAAPPA